jgi:hypothetical protein
MSLRWSPGLDSRPAGEAHFHFVQPEVPRPGPARAGWGTTGNKIMNFRSRVAISMISMPFQDEKIVNFNVQLSSTSAN